MEQQQTTYPTDHVRPANEEQTISEIIRPYVSRWMWIAASVVLFLFLGILYLCYASPEYKTTLKVLIKDEKRGQSATDFQIFSDLGIAGGSGNIDNELEILRSRTLMEKVADSLNLIVSYFNEGHIKTSEIYRNSPVRIELENFSGEEAEWEVRLEESGHFTIRDRDNHDHWTELAGGTFETPVGTARIQFTDGTSGFPVLIKIRPWKNQDNVSFNNSNKFSGVIDISMVSACPAKSEDILNTLVGIYNDSSVEEKRWVTKQSIDFIEDRLYHISEDLELIEKDVESYKQKYQLTDLQSEAGLYLYSGSENQKRILEISMQKEILSAIGSHVEDLDNLYRMIPSNLGITDISLLSLIEQYNKLQLSRREAEASMTEDNPILIQLENQILSLRNDILVGIKKSESSYNVTLNRLEQEERAFNSKIRNLSTNEREFNSFLRKQEITETIFLYLLQKQEESAIALSMAVPNARIIDAAYTDDKLVHPRRMIILMIALLLGVLIPVGIIYLLELFNVKISTREDIEKLTTAPILGETPEMKGKTATEILIRENDLSSSVAEQYWLLMTNLEFLLGEREKVMIVTSSVSNEGKSSFAVNLALAWATVGKKTLLVDLDLRNSRLEKMVDIQQHKGMSFFLARSQVKFLDTVQPSQLNKQLDVAPIGIMPPNPMQLLRSPRLDEFFRQAREQYDIIVVDTPPVLLVADSLIINRVSDATLYVMRVGVTRKPYLKEAEELYQSRKLKKLTYVIKGISHNRGYDYGYGYGYGYSYGYGEKRKKKKEKKR